MTEFLLLLLCANPPLDTERDPGQPLPAVEAAARFRVPPGFRVGVFASEPDIRNPITCAWDARGRLWVAENLSYADKPVRYDRRFRDRITILDDTDGDGRADSFVRFSDDYAPLTGLEVGRGGVWVLAPPRLLFVPDRDGDDKPDGPAEVLLDGFTISTDNHHNLANGLKWGPDGWLYGRCGASSPGRIGAPGSPDERRIPIHGGIWRYHPTRKAFEVLCHGTTNPWGHDWTERGECVFVNTVIGHLWHVIPGAHFKRSSTIDPNPDVFEFIDQHADHFHWDTAKRWEDSRNADGEAGKRGGGHAHSGATVYLGDNWPDDYRGKLLTLNFHGRRVNVERLERHGCGLIGRHEPDILFAADPFFRGVEITYGPDGGVYILDWSDTGECHENTGVHRSSGRIYKVTYGQPERRRIDLSKLDAKQLLANLHHKNEWFVRHAIRLLSERLAVNVQADLESICSGHPSPVIRLRAMWVLHALGVNLDAMVRDADESVRAWALRLHVDHWPIDTVLSQRHPVETKISAKQLRFLDSLTDDESGLVRLALASALQRLPVEQRLALAAKLVADERNARDANLPLLIWYGLIPSARNQSPELASIIGTSRMPTFARLAARKATQTGGRLLDQSLLSASSHTEALVGDILTGLAEGWRGMRKASKSEYWDEFAAKCERDPNMRDKVRALNVLFGDGVALEEVRRLALDGKADLASRRAALGTLIDANPDDLRAVCEKLIGVRFLNPVAARGLSRFGDAEAAKKLVQSYRAFHLTERPALLDALASRPAFAAALLDAVEAKRIPRDDVTAVHARQIGGFGDAKLTERLESVWGKLRSTPADRQELISRWKAKLTPEVRQRADLVYGRALFRQHCANCHKLYGEGQDIGPDLTGSNRDNLDYVLENIIDPSATVSADYCVTRLELEDGRTLTGIVKARTATTLTLQTDRETRVITLEDIGREEKSEQSLMPDGLIASLKEEQVRDLIAFLMHPARLPE